MVVIVGNRANNYRLLDVYLNEIEAKINRTFYRYEDGQVVRERPYLWFIISEGRPTIIPLSEILNMTPIEIRSGEHMNDTDGSIGADRPRRIPPVRERMTYRLRSGLQQPGFVARHHPEGDLIAAIIEAQRIFETHANNGNENYLFIVDSGVTTTGHLNMLRPYLNVRNYNAQTILERLGETSHYGRLPENMNNINVIFRNIGNTAGSEAELSYIHSNELALLWTMIFESANARSIDVSIRGNARGTAIFAGFGVPDVKIIEPRVGFEQNIPTPSPTPVQPFITQTPEPEPTPPPVPIPTPEIADFLRLWFMPDSAYFVDYNAAIEMIELYVNAIIQDNLNAYPEKRLYIVGSEASVYRNRPNPGGGRYAAMRTNAVKDVLVRQFNIPYAQIITINAGTAVFSWRNECEFIDGIAIPENMQRNRIATIIPSWIQEFYELIDGGFVNPN